MTIGVDRFVQAVVALAVRIALFNVLILASGTILVKIYFFLVIHIVLLIPTDDRS